MRPRSITGLNDFALSTDPLAQSPNPVSTFAALQQQLLPTGVFDSVFALNEFPQGQAMDAELSRRRNRSRDGRAGVEHG
jgi:hypothetical protein